MNYLSDIKIDETALDIECLRQADKAYTYGVNLEDCKDELNKAEEALMILKAELTDAINSDPAELLGEGVKPTLGNIDSCIIQSSDYQEASSEVNRCKHEAGIAKIAYDQIAGTRKSMLEQLVKLHGQNYFAGPITPRDIEAEASKVKTANSRVNMKRTKKEK